MWKKTSYIFILTVIVLVLLEISFRIAAFVKVELLSPSAEKTEGVFTILCVGDSTTEGLMVDKQFSYPSQLQKLLDTNVPQKKFRVINLGYGGINSSQVLNRFEKNLGKYRPDLIVLQVGVNDLWNMNESNMWRFDQSNSLNKIKLKADIFLSKLRVYQFAKLLTISYKEAHTMPFDDEKQSLARSYEVSNDKRKQLYELLAYNIGNMVRLAKQHNYPIFLQTYQQEGMGKPRELINKVYGNLAVPVVDNQSVFDVAKQQGLQAISEDNFHPNEAGYGLIARNVYNTMIKQGMVVATPLPELTYKIPFSYTLTVEKEMLKKHAE